MTIGEKIRFLRNKNNLSQEELAKALNTTKQAIYKYESGIVTNIPLDKIETLSNVLCTTPAYLMGWKENTTPTEGELDEGEKIWLDLYHRISEDSRDMLVKLVDAFDNLPAEERKFLLSVIELKLKK
jgi:transcriptional regulator with XRE-family HTH domain